MNEGDSSASNTGIIDNICRPAKVPVMSGDGGICSGCGVATLPVDYYAPAHRRGGSRAYLGHHGHRRVHHLPGAGCGRPDSDGSLCTGGAVCIMMDAGRVVADIRGGEKKNLTVRDLLEKFNIESDRMLLSE